MWQTPPHRKNGVEAGASPLYPTMLENPELRWAFILKIYSILSLQLLITIAVAAVAITVRPVALFFSTTAAGLALYIIIIITPFIVLCPLYYYHQTHPVNYFLLGLFTVSLAFIVGLTCAFTNGKVILESVILTAAVVISLTLYTFWAARRGHDFNFLGPFLFGAIFVLIIFALIQVYTDMSLPCLSFVTDLMSLHFLVVGFQNLNSCFHLLRVLFPLGKISVMIYGCLASIIFCGYIIYDIDNLIKRYSYDEYIFASVALYLDIINLFLSLLTVFQAVE